MVTAFLAFINERKLFSKTDRLLVAVSGGLDSVVLTHLLAQSGFSFGIAHVNFQLRGEESNRDEQFVRTLAQQYDVPLFVNYFDTKTLAAEKGFSIQLLARQLRYEWFNTLSVNEHFTRIVTAHHLNDSFETAVMNLIRGTGLSGLRGIPARNDQVVRPLLAFTRFDILQYAQEHQLSWVEDSSNQKTDYRRNQLRHQIIPIFQQLNPNLEHTFRHTAERLEATERLLAAQIRPFLTKAQDTKTISVSELEHTGEPLLLLSELLKSFDFSYQQSRLIFDNRYGQSGSVFQSATTELMLDREQWLIRYRRADPETEPAYALPSVPLVIDTPNFTLSLQGTETFSFDTGPTTVFMDADQLIFPLQLRIWQAGDWFCPLGMKGKTQKISDFLINRKVSVSEKKTIYVLTSDSRIIWVVGKQLDDRFKITDSTKRLIRVEVRFHSSVD